MTRQRAIAAAEAIVRSPYFAYTAIVLLQLRFMWGVWSSIDTTSGDTSYYYLWALRWAQHLQDNVALSPLYTIYFGTVRLLLHGVDTAVMAHRLVLVFVASLLVVAAARAVLGPALGFFVAVWWVLVPANFDIDYEAHLFGFLPVLIAVLVAARRPGRVGRGATLAILVGAALLARNELVVAAGVFAVATIIREWQLRGTEQVAWRTYVRAYGAPLLIVGALFAASVWQSPAHGAHARADLDSKHRLNMCQIYAFSYQQRHPAAFQGNPFTDCAPLMRRTFGRAMPSFIEEIRANPDAVAGFLAWNVRLAPVGLQVALLGASSHGPNPGYFPAKLNRPYADYLTVLMLVLVALGLAVAYVDRAYWWPRVRERTWPLVVLAGASLTGLFAALTQRPRPEYIYGLTLTLMMLTAFCVASLVRRAHAAPAAAPAALAVFTALLVGLPSYYAPRARPLHDALARLQPVRGALQRPGAVLVTSGYNWEICAYLARSYGRHCSSPSADALHGDLARGRPLSQVLDDEHATVIYADPILRADPGFAPLTMPAKLAAWKTVSAGDGRDGHWSVLVRRG